jgi:Xaa-Pro dipeptidase
MPTFDSREIRRLGSSRLPSWFSFRKFDELDIGEPPDFPLAEYLDRHARLLADLEHFDVDCMLTFRASNVRYLSGFHTFTWNILPAVVAAGSVTLCVTDDDLPLAVTRSCADRILHYKSGDDVCGLLAHYLRGELAPGARVGLDMTGIFTPLRFLTELSNVGLAHVDCGAVVEKCRLILSPAEQAMVRQAAAHTADGVRAAADAARRADARDSSVSAAIFEALVVNSDSLARGQVAVAAGQGSGFTHMSWMARPIPENSVTFLEFAGSHKDYCAPIIRTLASGSPAPEVLRLDQLARQILLEVIGRLRPGIPASLLANEVKNAVGALDERIFFHENFGYPVGVGQRTTWMDGAAFYLVAENPHPVVSGMAFHIPSSLVQVGDFGVGHSHTVLVHEDGIEIVTEDCGPPELIQLKR